MRSIRKTSKEMQGKKQKDLIERLNPIIKGWTNYHANQVSAKTFQKAHSDTWEAIWRWARQRHPNKSRAWIKGKYFHREGMRDWIFGYKGKDGKWVNLQEHSDTHITRHTKVKAEANPFDPAWETYWEERDKQLANNTFYGRVKALWKQQEGDCPMCRQQISVGDDFNIHHIVRRIDGGKETLDNLQLVHANCHRQHHANRGKPVNSRLHPEKMGLNEARTGCGESRTSGSSGGGGSNDLFLSQPKRLAEFQGRQYTHQ